MFAWIQRVATDGLAPVNGSLHSSGQVLLALLPVLAFLLTLVACDSFKLVPLRRVAGLVIVGTAMTAAAYVANSAAYGHFSGSFVAYSRYVSPLIEEFFKAIPLVLLIRLHRVGLLVEAAIAGFAVGTGFALVENLYYLASRSDVVLLVQIVRGFGTAVMHGGAAAIFGLVAIALRERRPRIGGAMFGPAFLAAVALHATFNCLLVRPVFAALAMALLLPVMFVSVFRYSEQALRDWMETGMDAKLALLRAIRSGLLLDTPAGQYLQALRDRFSGETLADMLCYLSLHGELALRAQLVLMMRETGWAELPADADTAAKLAELRQIERSIGRTGLLALHPLLVSSGKDLWQLKRLGRS